MHQAIIQQIMHAIPRIIRNYAIHAFLTELGFELPFCQDYLLLKGTTSGL